jgi:hypothetical protein
LPHSATVKISGYRVKLAKAVFMNSVKDLALKIEAEFKLDSQLRFRKNTEK